MHKPNLPYYLLIPLLLSPSGAQASDESASVDLEKGTVTAQEAKKRFYDAGEAFRHRRSLSPEAYKDLLDRIAIAALAVLEGHKPPCQRMPWKQTSRKLF